MKTPILTIRNRHVADCGTPPDFDAMDKTFVSYITDQNDDQFVYVKLSDGRDLLYIADASWESPCTIDAYGRVT